MYKKRNPIGYKKHDVDALTCINGIDFIIVDEIKKFPLPPSLCGFPECKNISEMLEVIKEREEAFRREIENLDFS